jgi:hypothetical protein
MASSSVDLAALFGNVAQVLKQNKDLLNSADTQNNDHGDNMVKVFNIITQALEKKSKGSATNQLEYASQQVEKNCPSGSGKVYAEGLARAASSLGGEAINSDNAMQLITALLGSSGNEQTSTTTDGNGELGNLIGSLLGGASEGQSSGNNAPADAISSLLGGLLGGEQSASQSGQSGIGLDQILAAGMEFMQSQKQGQDTMSSLLDAVVAGSQAGSGYRAQSGKLVASTLMQGLSSYLAKK